MFGYVTPHFDQLEEQDRLRYLSFYCGLCHAIGDSQGQLARFGLTYDMAFLAMLVGSLYEVDEQSSQNDACPIWCMQEPPFQLQPLIMLPL